MQTPIEKLGRPVSWHLWDGAWDHSVVVSLLVSSFFLLLTEAQEGWKGAVEAEQGTSNWQKGCCSLLTHSKCLEVGDTEIKHRKPI